MSPSARTSSRFHIEDIHMKPHVSLKERLNRNYQKPKQLTIKEKVRFPGPAGLIHVKRNKRESQSTQLKAKRKEKLELTDGNLAWQHLHVTEEVDQSKISVSLLDVYNIECAKRKTIKIGRSFKIRILAAAIKSVDTTGFDDVCQCKLVDETSAVLFLLYCGLIDRPGGSNIVTRTVLLLKNVTVQKQFLGKMQVVVTPNNLVSVYWT